MGNVGDKLRALGLYFLHGVCHVVERVGKRTDLVAPALVAGDSGIKLTLAAWTKSENYMDFKNQLFITVKETLDANNIEIPYKKLVLVK